MVLYTFVDKALSTFHTKRLPRYLLPVNNSHQWEFMAMRPVKHEGALVRTVKLAYLYFFACENSTIYWKMKTADSMMLSWYGIIYWLLSISMNRRSECTRLIPKLKHKLFKDTSIYRPGASRNFEKNQECILCFLGEI